MSDTALAITVDGNSYEIRMSNLTAIDAKDFRAAVGVSLAQAMTEGSADLDVVAGLVWLVRRKRERGLTFATVATSITYDSDLAFDEPVAEAVDSDPEI